MRRSLEQRLLRVQQDPGLEGQESETSDEEMSEAEREFEAAMSEEPRRTLKRT